MVEWFRLSARLVSKTNLVNNKHRMGDPLTLKFPINKFYTLVQMVGEILVD